MRLFLLGTLAANVAVGLLAFSTLTGMLAGTSWVILATHFMALGALLPIMVGALLQMQPVVAGVQVPCRPWFKWFFPPLLYAGLVSMGLAFSGYAHGFQICAAVLSMATLPTSLLLVISAFGSKVNDVTTRGMQGALCMILIAIVLGVGMLLAFDGIPWVDVMSALPRHVRFATIGWMALLVMTTAQNVVPMFQLTPAYPARLKTWLTPWVVAWCLAGFVPALQSLANMALAVTLACFAALTLFLQQKSKRPQDATVRFWKLGMWALGSVSVLWLVQVLLTISQPWDHYVLLGALFFAGCVQSVIISMLYKIVAFLVWWHLQKIAGPKLTRQVPNMRQVFASSAMSMHFRWHLAAIAGLMLSVIVSPWWPVLAMLALLPLIVANLIWARNLLKAWQLFKQTEQTLRQLMAT
ncbi:hypothetical protein [Leeia oryzae]|uniref:hypothetical protein n=1 Tax=Leeia oryzae TaxID=356662 RepID=UPI0012EAEEBE|nr:hypothetical protein [Leeia oryzae]